MHRGLIIGCVSAVALAAGCSDSSWSSSDHNGSYRSSSDGIAGLDGTTVRGKNGEKLVLYKPSNMTLKRGDAESVTVRMHRENFNGDVRVSVSNLPSGVEAVDAPRSTSSDSIKIVFRARDRADLVQNQDVLVTAEGPEGIRATESIKLTVRDRS